MLTTPLAMRSSVCAQVAGALGCTALNGCGAFTGGEGLAGWPALGGSGGGDGSAAYAPIPDKRRTHRSKELRGMPNLKVIFSMWVIGQDQEPHGS